jgi:rubredoxin
MSFKRDWKCSTCGFVSHDVDTRINDLWCPLCGMLMDKIYVPPTLIFNGGGWTPKFNGGKKEN